MTSSNWFQQRPLSAVSDIYFFSLFVSSSFFTLKLASLLHTFVKLEDRFSLSPTMQLTSRKQHLLQHVHTIFFFLFFCFCPTISKRSRQKWFTPMREKERKRSKRKKIQIFVPCFNPPQKWKKGPTLNTKISQFFYISNCLCWLLFRNTPISFSQIEKLYF